jgi:preprotein translocase subunit YajC
MKYIAFALASTALAATPLMAQEAAPAPSQSVPAAVAETAASPAPSTAANAPAGTAAAPTSGPANVTAGAKVADAQGGAVGTIESVSGANAVISTGTAKATLPLTAFAQGPNGLVIGMSKPDLEAAIAMATGKQTAAGSPGAATASAATTPAATAPSGTQVAQATPAPTAPASIAVGSTVSDTKGGKVGTIEAVKGDLVTVATANTKAQLPKSAFAQGANGLMIAMTATELDAAAKAAAPKKSGG